MEREEKEKLTDEDKQRERRKKSSQMRTNGERGERKAHR